MTGSGDALRLDQAYGHMARGSAWMIVIRWSIRSIGIVSIAILARLLTPEDFGVIAVAMMFVAAIEAFAETGQRLAVIRDPEAAPALMNTAWTLSVLQGVVVSLGLFALSPLAGMLLNAPEAVYVLYLLSIRPFLLGFQNIGVVAFRREFSFQKEVPLALGEKLAGVAVAIGLAAVLKSYWALAGGIVASALVRVLLSYWLHPYRPKLSLSRMRGLFSYSTNLLVQSLARVAEARADQFLIGVHHDVGALGRYNVAGELASAPTAELTTPMAAAFFPVYARLQGAKEQAARAYSTSLSVISTVALATGCGVALVADEFVAVLLGPQWIEATMLVRLLAISTAFMVIANASITPLNATGGESVARGLLLARLGLLVLVLVVVTPMGTVEQVAWARVVVMLISIPAFCAISAKSLHVSRWTWLTVTWRPIAATLAMTAVVLFMPAALPSSMWMTLSIKVFSGAGSFIGVCLILSWIAGAADDWERLALAYVRSEVRRRSLSSK